MEITPDYLRKLKANPEEALREAGSEPTAEMVAAIKALDIDALIKFLESFPQARVTDAVA